MPTTPEQSSISPDQSSIPPEKNANESEQKSDSSEPQRQSPKINKKRFKKLRKKATTLVETNEVSGLVTVSEWKEYQELNSDNMSLPGPRILWRSSKRSATKERATVEGVDHRDILSRILQLSSSSSSNAALSLTKKRKRENDIEESTLAAIPSWCTIHNPITVARVGVVEIHVDTESLLRPLESRLDQMVRKRTFIKSNTRWFQGHRVQSISDILMYTPVENVSTRNSSRKMVSSVQDLYACLLSKTLSTGQMEKEGYKLIPLIDVSEKNDNGLAVSASSTPTVEHPSAIDIEQAKLLLDKHTVVLENENGEENELPPFVVTPCIKSSESRIFALDCEMVETTAGLELARITLLRVVSARGTEFQTETVLDEIVRPSHKVLNYLTAYSGMTEDILSKTNIELQQIQAFLVSFMRSNDILVGHSLENDLKATRWIHPTILDTAVLFRPQHKRFKYSLRHLAARLLKLYIQRAKQSHCSKEDALAALRLAVHRAVLGNSFCVHDNRAQNNLVTSVAAHDNTVVCIGPTEWLQHHVTSSPNAVHALTCNTLQDSNCKASSAWLSSRTRNARLVWAKWNIRAKNESGDIEALVSALDDLTSKMQSDTILLIAIQAGIDRAKTLSREKSIRQNPKTTIGWDSSNEQEWVQSLDVARNGYVYWTGELP